MHARARSRDAGIAPAVAPAAATGDAWAAAPAHVPVPDIGGADEEPLLAALDRDDRYRTISILASGDSGTTELVEPRRPAAPGLPALLVRKRIPAPIANEPAWRAAAACSCPRLPAVRDLYRMPEGLVVVYDYVAGTPLSQLLGERGGRLSSRAACGLALDVCQAAAELHRHGVVHRDITPSNVVVAADGAHLTDLGIAQVSATTPDAGTAGAHLEGTADGAPRDAPAAAMRDTTTLGTLGFAAPEQFGFASTDARADVYAIGRLLASMVCGLPSRDGAGAAPVPEQMDQLRRIDPTVARVVAQACAFDRADRFQSAEELADAIAREVPQSVRPAPDGHRTGGRGAQANGDAGRGPAAPGLVWCGRAVSPAGLLLRPASPLAIARAFAGVPGGGRPCRCCPSCSRWS